jgi:Flp pilus assembly protein TadD
VQKAKVYASLVFDGFSSDPDADLANAIKAVDRALQLAPNDAEALRRKAFALHVQGDLDGAAALIRKALELDPLDGYEYRELGQIQIAQGHYKEALENFMIAKRLASAANTSNEPSYLLDRSVALGLLANDRFPEAIAEAKLAIAEL